MKRFISLVVCSTSFCAAFSMEKQNNDNAIQHNEFETRIQHCLSERYTIIQETKLIAAMRAGNMEETKRLLSLGANIDEPIIIESYFIPKFRHAIKPFEISIMNNDYDLMCLLINYMQKDQPLTLRYPTDTERSTLVNTAITHYVNQHGIFPKFTLLYAGRFGIKIEEPVPLLAIAVMLKNKDLAQNLLNNNANPSEEFTLYGETISPMSSAERNDMTDFIELFKNHKK